MPTFQEAKRELAAGLTAAGIEPAEAWTESGLIVEHATGLTAAQQVLKAIDPVDAEQLRVMRSIVCLREKRVPLQYCFGYAYFMGLKLTVRPGVLIPRQDTETLVAVTLPCLKRLSQPKIVDIGTGSGAIAISLLKLLPGLQAVAIDISADAIALARENALDHGVLERMELVHQDWAFALPDKADAILANPPYISKSERKRLAPEVVLHEPEHALFGSGQDGLNFYRQLSAVGQTRLNYSGFVALEFGDGQAYAVAKIFAAAGWQGIAVHNDMNGLPRVLTAAPQKAGFSNSKKLLE